MSLHDACMPCLFFETCWNHNSSLQFLEGWNASLFLFFFLRNLNELQHGMEHMTSQFRTIHGAEDTETEYTCKWLISLRNYTW